MNRSDPKRLRARYRKFGLQGIATACLAFGTAPANAEIRLLQPEPRYQSSNSSCPCGAGASSGTCDVERDGSDNARSSRISRFEVGETITVRVDEYIDELGRLRVAFDPSGADMEDFNANVLLDEADILEFREGARQFTVELPNIPCSDCTLQVVQVAHGITDRPVADPSPFLSFYACADIELVLPGATTASPPDQPDRVVPDAGMALPLNPVGTGGDGDPPASSQQTEDTAEAPRADQNTSEAAVDETEADAELSGDASDNGAGGCSLSSTQRGQQAAGWLLLLVLTSMARLRRSPRRYTSLRT